jgi:hypothetical protein
MAARSRGPEVSFGESWIFPQQFRRALVESPVIVVRIVVAQTGEINELIGSI